jgi:predicted nucleic acid-binding protein
VPARTRLTLDSNVLVYAVDRQAGRKHELARELVGRAALADCVLTLQALCEFFVVATRKGKATPSAAAAFVDDFEEVFPVVTADAHALAEAMAAHEEHRIGFWDAMLWATARRAGCGILVTEDLQDGRQLGGVRFRNPFGDALPADLEAALEGTS